VNRVRAIDKVVYNNYEYNGKKNPHKIYGYLRTPELAEIIHAFFNQDRNKFVVKLNNKIDKFLKKLFF
jgi:hypothetical protein